MIRHALVTGTSTGIGRSIALRLAESGVHVFAGVRRLEDAPQTATASTGASASAPGQITPLLLDVTSPAQIADALTTVTAATADAGLWALVNNAGVVVPGPIEFITPDQWRYQFEVNFFSMCEMVRAFLPLLRKAGAKLGAGAPRIMLVSSIGGRVAQPLVAPYTCSKFATTALGDSLRLELRPQGIGVTVIEPGAIATAIWGKGDSAASTWTPDHPARALYGKQIDGLIQIVRKTAASALSAETAADIAIRALNRKHAPARLLIGRDAHLAATFSCLLPRSLFDRLLSRAYGFDK